MPAHGRPSSSSSSGLWAQYEIDKLRRRNTELETRVKVLSAADREVGELQQEIALLKGKLVNYRINTGHVGTPTGGSRREAGKGGELAEFHDYIRQLEVENARLGMLLRDTRTDQQRRRSLLKQRSERVGGSSAAGEVVTRVQLRSVRGGVVRPTEMRAATAISEEALSLHGAIERARLRKVAELSSLESSSSTVSVQGQTREQIGLLSSTPTMDTLEGEVQQLRSLNSALNSRVARLTEAHDLLRTEFDCRGQDLQLVVSEMKRFLIEADKRGFTCFLSSSSRLDELLDGHFTLEASRRSLSPSRSQSPVGSMRLAARGAPESSRIQSRGLGDGKPVALDFGVINVREKGEPSKVALVPRKMTLMFGLMARCLPKALDGPSELRASIPASTSVYLRGDAQADITGIVCEGDSVRVADVAEYRFTNCHVSSPVEVVYKADLRRLVDAAVGGIDGVFLLLGLAASAEHNLFHDPDGLVILAVRHLVRIVEVADEKIRDLIGQASRSGSPLCSLLETEDGVTLSGAQSLMIDSQEAGDMVMGKIIRALGRSGHEDTTLAVWVDISQHDNMLDWATTSRLMLIKAPSLDCLTQDRDVASATKGLNTFKSQYTLWDAASNWTTQRPPLAVSRSSVLTMMLMGSLVHGSALLHVTAALPMEGTPEVQKVLELLQNLGEDARVCSFAATQRRLLLLQTEATAMNRSEEGSRMETTSEEALMLQKQLVSMERKMMEGKMEQAKTVDQRIRLTTQLEEEKRKVAELIAENISSQEGQLRAEERRIEAVEGLVSAKAEVLDALEEKKRLEIAAQSGVNELRDELDRLQQELEEKGVLLSAAQESAGSLRDQQQEGERNTHKLTDELKSVEVELAKERARNEELSLQIINLAGKGVELERERQLAEEGRTQVETELASLEAALDSESSSLRERLRQAEEDIEQEKQEKEQLRSELEQARCSAEEEKSNLKMRLTEEHRLQAERDAEELDRMSIQVRELDEKFENSKAEKGDLDAEVESLQMKLDEKEQRQVGLKAEVDGLRAEVARLEEESAEQRVEDRSKIEKLLESLTEAQPDGEAILIDATKIDPALTRLVEAANKSCEEEKRLRREKRQLLSRVRELEGLASSAKVWLAKIPEGMRGDSYLETLKNLDEIRTSSSSVPTGAEEEKVKKESAGFNTTSLKVNAADSFVPFKEMDDLRATVRDQKGRLFELQTESASKVQRLQVKIAAQEAELARLRHSVQFPENVENHRSEEPKLTSRENTRSNTRVIVDRLQANFRNDYTLACGDHCPDRAYFDRLQTRCLSNLNRECEKFLRKIQDLEKKLASARAQSPPDIRSLQNRCDVLEKQVERLEEERSGNIVRATVAEEQVTHLSEQLVALTQQHRKQGARPPKDAGGNPNAASNVLILTFRMPTMRSLAHLLAVCFVHGEEFSPDRCWAYGYTYNFCCLSGRSKACWHAEYNRTSCCAQPIFDTEIAVENRTIFLTEALAPKIDFPDINCELYEEWKEFRALAWAALGAELMGVEALVTIWGPRLLGEACMENAASCGGYVAQCRVGNLVVAMNILLSCLNQVTRASGSDAMHCIAWFDYFVSIWNGIDYNLLMATRWPVLETFERLFFTVRGLRAERGHIFEECDVDRPIDWITLRDFTSNIEFSGYNETVLKIISHHSLTEPPSQLRNDGICRPGLAIVCILKLWLCAASEPSCVHAYGDYLMQNELKWNDELSLIDWLMAEGGWNIPVWLRRMLRQSARHEMELGITLTDRIILG
ncbi:hypothetical protein FOZ62_021356, partial [Perkinsus olseni]